MINIDNIASVEITEIYELRFYKKESFLFWTHREEGWYMHGVEKVTQEFADNYIPIAIATIITVDGGYHTKEFKTHAIAKLFLGKALEKGNWLYDL